MVQWEMLWFSELTTLFNDLLNDGVILEKFHDTIHWYFSNAFLLLYWRMDEHCRISFHEVNTCSVGERDRVGLVGTQKGR